MRFLKILSLPAFIVITCTASAQINTKTWYQQDPAADSVDGISLNKTYQFLKGKNYSQIRL